MDHTAFNLQRTPCQPLPRKRSPDGTSTECGGGHLIAAHYSFKDPERMKSWVGLVGWPIADGCKYSPISYRSSAGRRKNAGQRQTFYRWATLYQSCVFIMSVNWSSISWTFGTSCIWHNWKCNVQLTVAHESVSLFAAKEKILIKCCNINNWLNQQHYHLCKTLIR